MAARKKQNPKLVYEKLLTTIENQIKDLAYCGSVKHLSISYSDLESVCTLAKKHFSSQQMCLQLKSPITVVGDIHGQLHDLISIFEIYGWPPHSRYLFLGDYIDRGRFSIEVILLLFILMLRFPQSVFLLRGNHESELIFRTFGFLDEIKDMFNESKMNPEKLVSTFSSTFNMMPVCAIICEFGAFCCHGGVSPFLETGLFKTAKTPQQCINLLNSLPRPKEVGLIGLVNDLLWADPLEIDDQKYVYNGSQFPIKWMKNTARGCSYLYSEKALKSTLTKFGARRLVRAHKVCDNGFLFSKNKWCMTIFSAPHYAGECKNRGAILIFSEKNFTVSHVDQSEQRLQLDQELLFW